MHYALCIKKFAMRTLIPNSEFDSPPPLDHIVQKNAQIVIGKNTHDVIKSYNQAVLFPKGYI